eukprot:GHVS01026102.1.p1 GENE.GHVS01026102.1~~GHVS01026102.1.p1  ORF type:complete len:178 (+),score=6.83 GHVS01026102.1:626-1159(+)
MVITELRATQQSTSIRLLDETHRSYDPLLYVLLFPYGTDGWCLGLSSQNPSSAMNPLLYANRLFQHYLVDMVTKIEDSRLLFICRNQQNLRAAHWIGLADAISDGYEKEAGRVILPSSFIGSPRRMITLYNDSMAIVRTFGKPVRYLRIYTPPVLAITHGAVRVAVCLQVMGIPVPP